MSERNPDNVVWPNLTYRDAPAAIAFLTTAFGFEQRIAHARDGAPTVIEHADDGLFARATAHGATVVRELRDEGNLWSFGTYTGA